MSRLPSRGRAVTVAAAATVAACGAHVHVGVDRRADAAGALAPALSGRSPRGGLIALGATVGAVALEGVVRAQEVDGPPIALLGAEPPPVEERGWAVATAALAVRVDVVRRGPVAVFVRGGPERAVVFDRSTAALSWGAGYGYGGGVRLAVGGLGVWVEVHRHSTVLGGGTTSGGAELGGVTVGMTLGE